VLALRFVAEATALRGGFFTFVATKPASKPTAEATALRGGFFTFVAAENRQPETPPHKAVGSLQVATFQV